MKINLSILLFSIFVLMVRCTKEASVDAKTISEVNNILDASISSQQDRFYKIERDIRNEMSDHAKFKYTPLLKAAGRTLSMYANFDNSYQEIRDSFFSSNPNPELSQKENLINSLKSRLEKIDQESLIRFDSILLKDFKVFGLRDYEMEKRLKDIRTEYKELQNTLIPQISADIQREDVFNFKLKSIQYAAIHKSHFFIDKFREFVGVTIECNFNPIFPIVQAKKNTTRVGEYFEAEVFIGNYYYLHPLEEPKIIINGDTLVFEEDKIYANYKFKPAQAGSDTLKLRCEYTNRLTGEISKGYSQYIVEVD